MVNYSVDYYEIIGVPETLSGAKLKIEVLKMCKEMDVEVRTTLPQRIRREAKEKLYQQLGREPTATEERTYCYEKTEDPNPLKRDREFVEKSIKFRLVNEAREIFLNADNKKNYDDFHTRKRQVTCFDHVPVG